jgi:hypothetical protein
LDVERKRKGWRCIACGGLRVRARTIAMGGLRINRLGFLLDTLATTTLRHAPGTTERRAPSPRRSGRAAGGPTGSQRQTQTRSELARALGRHAGRFSFHDTPHRHDGRLHIKHGDRAAYSAEFLSTVKISPSERPDLVARRALYTNAATPTTAAAATAAAIATVPSEPVVVPLVPSSSLAE